MKKAVQLVIAILICEGVGILGSFFTFSSIPTWYSTLNKPVFSPPNFIFGPVWTILYALMGIAAYLVWQKGIKKKIVKSAITLFGIHLFFNFLWSVIFFGLKSPYYAFLEIIILWLLIITIVFRFWRIDRRAAYLLAPYLLWVSFASFLNYTIWQLNP